MTARMIWCAVLGLVAGLIGCGDDGERPAGSETRLVVEVRPEGERGPVDRRTVVDCRGAEGDAERCRRLATLPPAAFDPVPRDRVCTQIYGGPATAVVSGRLRGHPVRARFSLSDGCEIDRWEQFAWLIGDPPAMRVP